MHNLIYYNIISCDIIFSVVRQGSKMFQAKRQSKSSQHFEKSKKTVDKCKMRW